MPPGKRPSTQASNRDFLFPRFENTSADGVRRPAAVSRAGVASRLALDAATNSTGPPFCLALAWPISVWLCLSCSLKASLGNPVGFHRSAVVVGRYWSRWSTSTKANSLSMSPGFLRAEDCAILELKCTPFFLRSRNCSNFLLVAGGGEPGGEGGMSMLGKRGKVRSLNKALLAEKGEPGGSGGTSSASRGASSRGGKLVLGPASGAWGMGPMTLGASFSVKDEGAAGRSGGTAVETMSDGCVDGRVDGTGARRRLGTYLDGRGQAYLT